MQNQKTLDENRKLLLKLVKKIVLRLQQIWLVEVQILF